MKNRFKTLFLLLLIGSMGFSTGCIGGKKSRCEECPEFTNKIQTVDDCTNSES